MSLFSFRREWRGLLVLGLILLFFGYWIFILQSDFRYYRELSQRHGELAHLLQEEEMKQHEYQRELQSITQGHDWDRLIREWLWYVRPGEVVVRPVWVPHLNQPELRVPGHAKP